jgi:hypothetical protein
MMHEVVLVTESQWKPLKETEAIAESAVPIACNETAVDAVEDTTTLFVPIDGTT